MILQGITDQTSRIQASEKTVKPTNGFAKQMSLAVNMGKDLEPIFDKASQKYGVSRDLLRSIAFHESGFQSDAISSAGAMGIMQLMPVTAQTMGVTNPYDAEQNIMGGAKLLGQYAKQYDGDLKLMLAAYGAGSGAVAKYNGVPPYAETKQFVEDIMSVVDNNIVNKPEPQEPVYQKYPKLWGEMKDFSNYTKEDYQFYLACLMTMNANILDQQNMFYLG